MKDIYNYFQCLTNLYGCSWHPDDVQTVSMRNAFRICAEHNADIYEKAMRVTAKVRRDLFTFKHSTK